MFETGFLSNKAPLFMDLVSLYFLIFPFLLFVGIFIVHKKKFLLHKWYQLGLFFLTLAVIIFFEIGIRWIGGFKEFLDQSSISHEFFISYLSVHIFIALISVVGWVIILIKSHLSSKRNNFDSPFFKKHKFYGRLLILGLTLTAYSGAGIYAMLFLF